jgi:hypothetical protein
MQGQNIVACDIFPEVNEIGLGIMNHKCPNTDWDQVLQYMRNISHKNPALINLKDYAVTAFALYGVKSTNQKCSHA